MAVLSAAVALAAILVVASQLSARHVGTTGRQTPDASAQRAAAPGPSLFAGLEQQGVALGSPRAPVTLVEYADLQCPYCAQWARDALPTVVEEYVRTGKLRLVFHGLAFIGPDSDTALRTAIAAGRQNHLWDVVHGLFRSQGDENVGWVTDELITEIAVAVSGLDGERLLEARWERSVELELQRVAAAARAAGVTGTPSFQVGPTGGRLEPVQVASLGPEGIIPAIEAVLAR
ncbi:MAG: thioredoxin domain-containing protein [Acidimicrobiia bacterium]